VPAGTFAVRPGVSAPVALRGLLAGAFFGVESLIPLALTEQHGYGATEAGLPLTAAGLIWAVGSWWQGRIDDVAQPRRRLVLIRVGFLLIAAAAAGVAVAVVPAVPGWLMYLVWLFAGLGAGLSMSSLSVLLLKYTNDADRGADSAALQLADATSSALTTGVAGVLIAAAARGALTSTTAFVTMDLGMCAVALAGAALAGRARPPAAPDGVVVGTS
jgi:sugar phosphate permease